MLLTSYIVFTITSLKQTILLQRFYGYSLWSKHVMNGISHD